MIKTIVLCLALSISSIGFTQSTRQFGKILAEEFNMQRYEADTTAKAVILFDYGETVIGKAGIVFLTHRIVKFFEDDAFYLANVFIPYPEGTILKQLKAVTYNIENGEIVKSEIDKQDVYSIKEFNGVRSKKFAMPDIKPGSIIEYTYTTHVGSYFFLNSWDFQSEVPTVLSEYRVKIPTAFDYKVLTKGFEPIIELEDDQFDYHFIARDVPAFVEEKYITSAKNYITSIDFELTRAYLYNFYSTFEEIRESLMISSSFGEMLDNTNFLKKKVDSIKRQSSSNHELAKGIYNYVIAKTNWNEQYNIFATAPFKRVINGHAANSADINLLLTSLYKTAGLEAWPVILSTRENGFVHPVYPFIKKYNTVICRVNLGEDNYVLADATHDFIPFGTLPEQCLNGRGRLITDKKTGWVDLAGKGKRDVAVGGNFELDEDGILAGTLSIIKRSYDAAEFRNEVRVNGLDEVLKKYQETPGWEINNTTVENIENVYSPVKLSIDLDIAENTEVSTNTIYLNPILFGQLIENPFKVSHRDYPVDFTCPQKQLLLFKIKVPAAYHIEELPEPQLISLPHQAGVFSYSVQPVANEINVIIHFKMNQVVFDTFNYLDLKEFYSRIITIENQQIVLSKNTGP